MKTDLYYYTGTGNSLWTARMLAEELGETAITPIARSPVQRIGSEADAIGIIFPVHTWGLPPKAIALVNALAANPLCYYFAVAVNAGQVAATLIHLKRLMHTKGMNLSAGFGLVMPSNYIPWGGPGPREERMKKIAAAREKIKMIASAVAGRVQKPVEKGPLWQNILFTWFNRLAFPRVPVMDKSFWVDEKCNACGICRAVCPCGNIELATGRPVWQHNCEQCLACIQWCPEEAIQFGKRTPRYERYHHPDVTLHDMIAVPPIQTEGE